VILFDDVMFQSFSCKDSCGAIQHKITACRFSRNTTNKISYQTKTFETAHPVSGEIHIHFETKHSSDVSSN